MAECCPLFFDSPTKTCAQKMKKRLFSGILLAVTPGILSSSCIKMTKPEEGFAAISAAISPSREVVNRKNVLSGINPEYCVNYHNLMTLYMNAIFQ